MTEPPRLLRDLERETGFTLWVEGAEQSYVDTADPTHLEFEYMQHIALVVDLLFDRGAPLSALHLGGGACTMPRWLAATRPGSRQTVIEASAEILRAVRPLGSVPGARVIHDDAVERLRRRASNRLDLVIWDLYDGPRVVTSRLTLDVVTNMERVLAPGGIAMLNVSDMIPFDVVRPVVAAMRVVFADVVLLAEPSILRGRRSGNCLLVGATRRLPILELRRAAAAAPVRARLLADAALDEFAGDAVPPTEDAPLPLPDEKTGRGFL